MGGGSPQGLVLKKLLLLALAASAIGSASARDREFTAIDNRISLGYELTGWYYTEPSDTCALGVCGNVPASPVFDRESGFLNGLRASLAGLAFDGRLYGRLVFARAWGDVRYQGYSRSGAPIPEGLSGARVSAYSLRLGPAVSAGRVLAVPFLQYGHEGWRRIVGVATPQRYEEDYGHDYLGFGTLFQLVLTPRWVLSAYALAGETLNAGIRVPSLGFAQALGTGPLLKGGALLDWRLSRAVGLYAGVRYTRFSYGQSPPQVSGNLVIMEPASQTIVVRYEGGLRIFF